MNGCVEMRIHFFVCIYLVDTITLIFIEYYRYAYLSYNQYYV